MEAVGVVAEDCWSSERPVVLAPPVLEADGKDLAGRLASEAWAEGAVVFASSGSSGSPKWVVHFREGLLCSARVVNAHLGVGADDHWFLALPEFHVGGFGVVARAHAAGCGVSRLAGGWDAEGFSAALAECGGTHTSLVPAQVHDLVASSLRCPAEVRAVVVGGGALDLGLGRRARALGWPVLQSYGMTEAASQVATAGMEALEGDYSGAPLPVLPHWETRTGADGVLELRGPALCSGYVALEGGELRRENVAPDGWFTTTDRVELEGGRLQFLGRNDRVVKVLGELVNLADLEKMVADALGVATECRVVAVPDARAGQRLVPVFEEELAEGACDLLAGLSASLPGFSRLAPPVIVGAWPRTPLGKVDLPALEQRIAVSGE